MVRNLEGRTSVERHWECLDERGYEKRYGRRHALPIPTTVDRHSPKHHGRMSIANDGSTVQLDRCVGGTLT